MAAPSSAPAVPCLEVFDENSQPSVEEISDYAQQIGIDPHSESYLLPLAKDGLMQALPAPWKAYYDDKLKAHYFYNTETKATQWDHPLDQVYKSLVVKARQASERGDSILDDTCVSIQDLITYEEDAKQITEDKFEEKNKSKDGDSSIDTSLEEEIPGSRSTNLDSSSKKPTFQKPGLLASIGRKTLPSLNSLSNLGDRKLGDVLNGLNKKVGESNTFPRTTAQLGINRFKNFNYQQKDEELSDSRNESPMKVIPPNNRISKLTKQASEIIDLSFNPVKNDDDNEIYQSVAKKGLILTGGGSVFLKSNRSNIFNANEGNLSLPSQQMCGDAKTSAKPNISITSDNPKGILRDRNFGELSLKSPFLDKNESIKHDLEEDKKSVRFNLEQQDMDIQFDYSPSPSSNSSSDMLLGGNQNSVIQGDRIYKPEISNASRTMMRRNSENSIGITDIPNFVKNGKLKPITYEENAKYSQQMAKEHLSKEGRYSINSKSEDNSSITNSPTRKLIKPNPGDFIKPNLFQKPFEKLSDILKTTSPDSESESDKLVINSSPPPMIKRKLSINLMESVDSEASIDSPDKESINLNLPTAVSSSNEKRTFQKESRRTESSDSFRKSSINKMMTVGEDDSQNEVKKFKAEMTIKKNAEINEIKTKMDLEIKEKRLSLEMEFKKEIDALKEKLHNEHAKNKADINEAIIQAQKNHHEDIQEALNTLNLEFSIKRERTIQEERGKLSEELAVIVKKINAEHLSDIEKLKQDKKNQLISIANSLEQENMKSINELRLQYSDNLEAEKLRLIADNKSALDKMKSEHEIMCDELRKDYRSEVELVRGQQAAHLSALREKLRREREPRPPAALSPPSVGLSPRDETSYERLRCDKRLLEDKYRCLKEKYARLKSDVKISIERRNKRREQSLTTGSETERSHSHRTVPSTDKSCEPGDPNSANKDCLNRVGKRPLPINNGLIFNTLKNGNNNEIASQIIKESSAENNNLKSEHATYTKDPNTSHSDSIPHQNSSCLNTNLLNVASRNLNAANPDRSRGKSPNIRDKSPMGRIYQKSFNGDNDNDISLSQSDSHTVSNSKYNKRVNIVESKDRFKEDLRLKSGIRKTPKLDRGYVDTTVTDYHDSSDTGASDHRHINESLTGKHRKKLFTRLKSASTSRLNYSVSSKLNERACSPVENLRQQLRKLEDLEEQFPDATLNADTTAYRLRYPFPDSGNGGVSGGELGFLRHRALVEREGVRRARAVLRRRADLLRQRRRSPAAWQEECELTDMEVSLHRTKSILGEKVIRLRHIEKSLRRIQGGQEHNDSKTDSNVPKQREPENKQDTTLSDISSHSSGFSSTDGHSDTNRNAKHAAHSTGDYEHSSEIINSLQTLNTEIRDIWQVLNSQQQMNVAKVVPIGQLLYTDVGWQLPIAASNIPNIQSLPNSISINVPALNIPMENINSVKDKLQNFRQTGGVGTKVSQPVIASGGVATSLVERTRDLRDWLKQQAAL